MKLKIILLQVLTNFKSDFFIAISIAFTFQFLNNPNISTLIFIPFSILIKPQSRDFTILLLLLPIIIQFKVFFPNLYY